MRLQPTPERALLRDYFPKGAELGKQPSAHLAAVENEINMWPRVILMDRAPAAEFEALLASLNHRVLRR